MAKKATKHRRRSKAKPDVLKEANDIKKSAIQFLGGVEKTGEKLAEEIKGFFEQIATHVASVANKTARTTTSVAQSVASVDAGHHLSRVLEEVKEAGEASIRTIGEGFDALREHIVDLAPGGDKDEVRVAKKRSKTGKKKARRKKTTKKKPTTKKRASRKKAASKKTSKRKTRKKAPSRKKSASKKTIRKKSAAKKATTKKKVNKRTHKKRAR